MDFKPGETYKRDGGKVYTKDSAKKQTKQTKPKPIVKQDKQEDNAEVQHVQVVQRPKKSTPKRKQSRSSSKSNGSSNSGS